MLWCCWFELRGAITAAAEALSWVFRWVGGCSSESLYSELPDSDDDIATRVTLSHTMETQGRQRLTLCIRCSEQDQINQAPTDMTTMKQP